MSKKIHSLLALLLVCSLVLTCLPTPVLAAELEEAQLAVAETAANEEEDADADETEATAEETVTADEMEAEADPSEEADSGEESAEEREEAVETTWTTVDDPTEIARLIRDSWSDDYFQEVVVDTRRNQVTVDGESAELSEVFDDVTEAEEDEIFSSVAAAEDYFADTAYETETQSSGTVSVTAPYQTCRILLTAKSLTEDYGAVTILEYAAYNEYVLQFATAEDTQAAYEQLVERYGAENCFVDEVITADDLFLSDGEEETTTTYSWGTTYMGLDTLKASASSDNATVTVAIIDSGIDPDHEFFEGRTITDSSYDFLAGEDEDPTELSDSYGHGTHVAGIIVECTPDNVELMVLRVLNDSGSGTLALVKTAMQYALEHGADVMNLSLGVKNVNTLGNAYTYLDEMIQTAYDAGVPVCCAAGNYKTDVYYPAASELSIAVSAIQSDGSFAESFSNYGEEIDFCAPGDSIISACTGGGTTSKSGTSMAAAFLTAAFTYVITACPDATVDEMYSVLQSCTMDLGDEGRDVYYGWGCVTGLSALFTNLDELEFTVTLSQTSYTYDGTAKEPAVTVTDGEGDALVEETDYTVSYSDNTNAGTATVTITGIGRYTGSLSTDFTIEIADLADCTVTVPEATYIGSALVPAVTVMDANGTVLTENTDYTVTYEENMVNAGSYAVTVTGIGNCSGAVSAEFTIAAENLSTCTVELSATGYVYDGTEQKPAVSVTDASGTLLTEETDYVVSYKDNVGVGTATVTVTGTGNYTGSTEVTFSIGTADLSDCTVTVSQTDFVYDGEVKEPDVTIVDESGEILAEGVDYTVSYSDNINAGTATVTVTGIGNYVGIASATFTIEAADLSTCTVTADSVTYTGSAQTPDITVKDANGDSLTAGIDYEVGYEENMVNVGSYDITVTGTGNYSGSAAAAFVIAPLDLSAFAVSLAPTSYTYDGKTKTPVVTVQDEDGRPLTEDTDFTVSYDDNVNAGTATVTVTGIGNYTGTVTADFTINKAKQTVTASVNSSSVVVGKTAQITASAQGTLSYKSGNTAVATVNNSGKVTAVGAGTATITVTAAATDNYLAGSATLTVTVQFATPTLTGVSNTSSGVKITWKAVSGAAKYQVLRKTGSGSWTDLGVTTSASYTDTTAKSGTTYRYTVRCINSAGTVYTSGYNGTGLSIKYLTAGKISSLTNTSSGITVKWSKVSGASGYYVYRKTSSGSYKKIATVKSGSTVSYSDTAVKSNNGTTYIYAVRPYYGSTLGSYTGKTTVRLTGVSISSLKNVKTRKMTVKWKKNTKASGYQIQYSTSSSFSSYKTVTVSSYKTVSKTISSLTKGKKYYVRVRAYKTVSGTNYYAAWSSKKNVKISK
ncbi:MAG: S8 family serine peptidase [Clostridiales bacterium]|nr:S8 family serine peptidase [Clostridiales bacterium]